MTLKEGLITDIEVLCNFGVVLNLSISRVPTSVVDEDQHNDSEVDELRELLTFEETQ